MPSEEKQKINVWIPGSLWKQIGSLGYESPTKAAIAAFEALVLQETKGSNQEVLGSSQEEVRKLQEETKPAIEKRESRYPQKDERVYETVQEDSPAVKESPDIESEVKQEDKNHWKKKETTIEKTCKNCLQPFLAKNPKNEYCSPKCRIAYNRRK